MKTLIIYDDEGYILSNSQSSQGEREPVGVPFIHSIIPEGKQVSYNNGIGVDVSVTPHKLILEDIPLTETEQLKKQVATNLIATRKLIRVDELTEEELGEMVDLYESWEDYIGLFILKDKVVKYKGKLYKVIKGLDVLEIYPPNIVPSEYVPLMPENVIPEWVQPTGAHDSYSVGDKAIYDGDVWISKINGNTTVPNGDVPHNRYWELV